MGTGDFSEQMRRDPEGTKRRLLEAATRAKAAQEEKRPPFAAGLESDYGAARKDGDRPTSGAESPKGDAKTVDQDDDQEPRKFPLWCLPRALADIAVAIADSARVPLELTGPIVLGIVSGAIGKGLKLKSGADRMVRGNLYLLGIAESA